MTPFKYGAFNTEDTNLAKERSVRTMKRGLNMKQIIKTTLTLVCSMLLGISTQVGAMGTPDGLTPAQEDVCDEYSGAAFGLCNAYCEAMDCGDQNQHASDQGCRRVAANFYKQTGEELDCVNDPEPPGPIQCTLIEDPNGSGEPLCVDINNDPRPCEDRDPANDCQLP